MKLLALSIFGLLGFFLIVLLCIKLNASIIENELTQQAHQALAKNGLNRITATADGQTLILKGTAIHHEDRLLAESIVKTIQGITEIDNQLTLITSNDSDEAAFVSDPVDQSNTVKLPETLTESNKPVDSIAPITPIVPIVPIAPIVSEPSPAETATTPVFAEPIRSETPIAPQAPMPLDPPQTPVAPLPLKAPIAPEALFQPIVPMAVN